MLSPWQLQRIDLQPPCSPLPQGCPRGKTPHSCPQFPPCPHTQLQGQLVNSLSCLHFFRVTDKSPTRSKMRATTPMEPETAVAAVSRLREVNERMRTLQCPGRLWGLSTIPGASPLLGFHLPNSQPSPASMSTLFPLPRSPRQGPTHASSHTGPSRPPSKIPDTPPGASPSFTHLLGSVGPDVEVVMFSAERERKFESNSLTHAID